MKLRSPYSLALGAACLSLLLGSGCASKRYVRDTVAPVDDRVQRVQTQTDKNSEEIARLDTTLEADVSRLEERTSDALDQASDAQSAAEKAQISADAAADSAAAARAYADSGLNRLERTMVDMTRFERRGAASILFGFDSRTLTDESKSQLAAMAASAKDHERYVLEVRGFTDSTGSPDYNLKLSEDRADAVVRELTGKHGVPLRAIYRIGLGQENPAVENTDRESRKQNRRVEVTLFTPRADVDLKVSSNGLDR